MSACVATLLVLSRTAVGIANVVGYPVWILSGFFIPVPDLSPYLLPLASCLPTYWLMELFRWAMTDSTTYPITTIGLALMV
ncbi:ABC transporter permease, partial [Streptococcus pneumoniae]|uniref:ABC transporter permease n=1 Tax=Streptococcus pneumoniae TaxID=1313 RepID=UPI001CB780E9